jgi:3-phenylpropionate/trans-cinnamate dioxygenase ferredoxin reductase subunit
MLAITTGTRVRNIPVPGVELKGVLYSRGIDDIRVMRALLDSSPQVAIIGAGFIGLETAAVLRGMGKDVVVLEMQDRVMPRVVAPIVSTFYQKLHESHGVVIRTQVTSALVYQKRYAATTGKEFCGKAMLTWAHERDVKLFLIDPGKPNQNAYIESFNGRFRDECLNEN